MYGDYECMRYGSVADCLVDLTGGMPERYLLRDLHVADDERTRERHKAALGTHSLVMLTSDKAEQSPAQVRWANDVRSARASTARAKEDEDGEYVDDWPTIANRNKAHLNVNSPRSDDERSDEEPDEEDDEEDAEGEEDGEEENDEVETEGTASGNVSRSVSARSRGVQSARRRKPNRRPSPNLVAGPGPLIARGLMPCRGYILEGMTKLRVGIGKKPATVALLRLCNPWNEAAWTGPWSAEYVHWCTTR